MSDLTKLSVKNLKLKLKLLKLPVSGKKSVLIERLLRSGRYNPDNDDILTVLSGKSQSVSGKRKAKRKKSRKVKRKKSRKKSRKASRKKSRKKSRKASRKASRKKSRKSKAIRKKSRKSKAIRKKSRKSKAIRKKSARKPSKKLSRADDWKNKTRKEISTQLKGMSVKEIKGSPYFKQMKYLQGKSNTKRALLLKHLEDVILKDNSEGEEDIPSTPPSTPPSANKYVIKLVKSFSRKLLKENPQSLYIFGENDKCYKTGQRWRKTGVETGNDCFQTRTQAVIRGEPNAAPIITMSHRDPKKSNKDIEKMIRANVSNILKELKTGKYNTLVFSTKLVGTGVAKLDKLPGNKDVWKTLQTQLARLKPSGGKLPEPAAGVDVDTFARWLVDKKKKSKCCKTRQTNCCKTLQTNCCKTRQTNCCKTLQTQTSIYWYYDNTSPTV